MGAADPEAVIGGDVEHQPAACGGAADGAGVAKVARNELGVEILHRIRAPDESAHRNPSPQQRLRDVPAEEP